MYTKKLKFLLIQLVLFALSWVGLYLAAKPPIILAIIILAAVCFELLIEFIRDEKMKKNIRR